MNIEDMIMNGASDEEIQNALNQIKAEKARREQALRAQNDKEALKVEARAHFINAVLAYSEAFDLLEEGEEWTKEELDAVEAYLIQIEKIIPMYAKMMKKKKELGLEDLFGLI